MPGSQTLHRGESPDLRKGIGASDAIEAAMERRKRKAYPWLCGQLCAGEHDETSQWKPWKIICSDPGSLAAKI